MTYSDFKSRVISAEKAYYKSICQLSLADFAAQADKLADKYLLNDIYPAIDAYMRPLTVSVLDYNVVYCKEMLEICNDFKAIKAGVVRGLLSNQSNCNTYLHWLEIKRVIEG